MALLYITGSPGSGKSSVKEELVIRGYASYGGGEDGFAAFYNNDTGKRIDNWVTAEQRTPEWRNKHTWKLIPEKITQLKSEAKHKPIFLCAIAKNEVEFWDLFDKFIVLDIDEDTMQKRLATRTNNDVGKAESELKELLADRKLKQYPQNAIHIDASRSLNEVVKDIIVLAS